MGSYPITGTFVPDVPKKSNNGKTRRCPTCGFPVSTDDRPELHGIGFPCSMTKPTTIEEVLDMAYVPLVNSPSLTLTSKYQEDAKATILATIEQLVLERVIGAGRNLQKRELWGDSADVLLDHIIEKQEQALKQILEGKEK